MQSKTMKLMMLSAAVLVLCLSGLTRAGSAGSSCKEAKGKLSVVNNGNGTTSGTITQGGRLNGTTQAVFTSGFTATPDPNTFSYNDNLTLTTNKGVLKTSNVGIFDLGTGLFSEIARINPSTSTGDFAGATGVLFIFGKSTDGGATFQAEIDGDICFAHDGD
jgi:hypothetical protein